MEISLFGCFFVDNLNSQLRYTDITGRDIHWVRFTGHREYLYSRFLFLDESANPVRLAQKQRL